MKDLDFNCWQRSIPGDVVAEIISLAHEMNIGEEYDRACDLVYTWSEDNKIVALIAFKQTLFSDGRIIPRIEHIIFDKNHHSDKKARTGFIFFLHVFKDLASKFDSVWAYIQPEKKYMEDYALRFGFSVYSYDGKGNYLVKHLNKERT